MEVHLRVHGSNNKTKSENKENQYVVEGTLTRQPTHQGIVVFDDVVLGVLPGSEVLVRFSSDPLTTVVDNPIEVDPCDPSDQVLYRQEKKRKAISSSDEKDRHQSSHYYYYCLDEKTPDSIAVDLVYAAVAVVLAIAIVTLLLLIWKRNKKPINNATPSMCYTIVIGVIFCSVSVTMWTTVEDATCALRGWLLALGLTMIFGAIFVRAYRLLLVFRRTTLGDAHAKRRVITNLDLGIGVSCLLAMIVAVLIVWMAIDPPNKREVIKIDVSDPKQADNSITYECNYGFPSSVFIIILIVFDALLLAFNCVVAFLTRNIPSNFNESKHIAFTVSSLR